MLQSKEKKLVKVNPVHSGVDGGSGSINEVNTLVESSTGEKGRKEAKNKHHGNEVETERNEMDKIEALCQQFGVPDPGELYIIPRDFEISGKQNLTQFSTKMPEGLTRWVDEAEFEYTIGKINSLFAKAEEVNCKTVLNGFCKFFTCFLVRVCQRTRTERAIIGARNFVLQQNQDIYHPKGFHIVDPAARGLRHIEFRSITYYSMKYFLEHKDEIVVGGAEFQVEKEKHRHHHHHHHHHHRNT